MSLFLCLDNVGHHILLRGHIFCKTCNYRMVGRYQTSRKLHIYPYYVCANHRNKYSACPDLTTIRTDKVGQLVWDDCCRVFERLDLIRDTIERSIEASLQNILEDTKGKVLLLQLTEELAYAKQERANHPEGSYHYKLISQDVMEKEERLARYKEEYKESRDVVKISQVYQKSILGFLDFLNTMKGKYHEATFLEKRNALNVLGVKVYIHPTIEEAPAITAIETDQKWLSISKAAGLAGIKMGTLNYHVSTGELKTYKKSLPLMVIHREELARYLKVKRPNVNLEQYDDEWFSVNKMVTLKLTSHPTIHRAIRLGEVKTQTLDIPHPFIHRDELNRFLRESPVTPKEVRENIQPRIEITYTPIFTGVHQSFG